MSVSRVRYSSPNGRFSVEVDGSVQKEIFKELSSLQEVFCHDSCGKCKSENIYPRVRVVDENEYFELVCRDCRAKLSFGVHKKGGTLFPKRKNEDGSYKENGGWEVYTPQDKEETSKKKVKF